MTADAAPGRSPRMRVVRAIRDWVAEGKLAAGERLPAEETLAASLGVARGTVRSAIRELTAQGVLSATAKYARRTVVTAGGGEPRLLSRACVLLSDLPEGGEIPVLGFDDAVQIAIRERVRAEGMSLLSLHPSACTAEGLAELLRSRPLGVLAAHAVTQRPDGIAVLARLRDAGVAVVAHGDGPGLGDFDRVSSDSAQGTGDLVRWLAGRGRRRILRAWSVSEPYWLHERDRGFAAACAGLGLPLLPPLRMDEHILRRSEPAPGNLEARTRLLAGHLVEHLLGREPPDAVIATSDSDVFPLAAAIRLFGREPGRDLLVCGYDDYWATCWERELVADAPAATVAKDNDRIGAAMVALLLERADGRLGPGPRHVTVPQRVVAGEHP